MTLSRSIIIRDSSSKGKKYALSMCALRVFVRKRRTYEYNIDIENDS